MIVVENGFAFLFPEIPKRLRANCKGEWGYFVDGETGDMNCMEAEKQGLLRGKFVEMALTWMGERTLTFLPHYENEQFTEIWGLPTAGEIKNVYPEKSTELITFLIHRRSQDKLKAILADFGRKTFKSWVADGMKGDPNQYAEEKASEIYFNNIFRFEFEFVQNKKGPSFFIRTTHRPAATDFEIAALKVASNIYQNQLSGGTVCTDNRILLNEQQCLNGQKSLAPSNFIEHEQPIKNATVTIPAKKVR